MQKIRTPAVAGTFYPDQKDELKAMLESMLNSEFAEQKKTPKAIVAPHAGYIYSGATAARVYKNLESGSHQYNRVILIGPSHHVSFEGLALPSYKFFMTPLGHIEIDHLAVEQILHFEYACCMDQAHMKEHSLEVHLPFLQWVLQEFKLVPIVTGNVRPEQVAEIIELFFKDQHTFIVISTDLSHFLDYESAQKKDKNTTEMIEKLAFEKLSHDSACGRAGLAGLLLWARQSGHKVKTVDLRNSGDTAGDKNRVVGYGAYVIE